MGGDCVVTALALYGLLVCRARGLKRLLYRVHVQEIMRYAKRMHVENDNDPPREEASKENALQYSGIYGSGSNDTCTYTPARVLASTSKER